MSTKWFGISALAAIASSVFAMGPAQAQPAPYRETVWQAANLASLAYKRGGDWGSGKNQEDIDPQLKDLGFTGVSEGRDHPKGAARSDDVFWFAVMNDTVFAITARGSVGPDHGPAGLGGQGTLGPGRNSPNWRMNYDYGGLTTNPGMGGVITHRGWAFGVNKIYDDIKAQIARYPNKKLWLVGHSLGGAIAGYLTYRLMREQALPKGAMLITFGAAHYAGRLCSSYEKPSRFNEAKKIGFEPLFEANNLVHIPVEFADPRDDRICSWYRRNTLICAEQAYAKSGFRTLYSANPPPLPDADDTHSIKNYIFMAKQRLGEQTDSPPEQPQDCEKR